MSRRARKYRDSRSWSLPLYYGSGEPADEDLAQAIEDLPLPDADTADCKLNAALAAKE